ncbi:hypothetical protein NJ76_27780, partial [Rhodococcus sp. IITR03]
MVGGAVLVQRSTADGPVPGGEEGSAVTSSHDAVPNGKFGVEDDCDVSLEDPVIKDGEPTTWEGFARDAAVGQDLMLSLSMSAAPFTHVSEVNRVGRQSTVQRWSQSPQSQHRGAQARGDNAVVAVQARVRVTAVGEDAR